MQSYLQGTKAGLLHEESRAIISTGFESAGGRLEDCRGYPSVSITQSPHNGRTLQSGAHVPGIDLAWTGKGSRWSVEPRRPEVANGGSIQEMGTSLTTPNPAHNPELQSVSVADDPKCKGATDSRENGREASEKQGAALTERCH